MSQAGESKGGESPKPQDALDRWRADDGKDGDKDGDDQDDKSEKKDGKPRFYQTLWFKIVLGVIIIILVAGGILWWLDARQYEDTDDAFIDTHIIYIAPQISGAVDRDPGHR